MEGLTPGLQCLQLAEKVEWKAEEAAVVLLGWGQKLLYSAVSEAVAGTGQQEEQEVKAALGEADVLVV